MVSCNIFKTCMVVLASQSLMAASSLAQEITQHDTQLGKVQVEKIIGGLDTPWAMAMLPDGTLLITERDGRLLHADPSTKRISVVEGVPEVWASGQGGLLDIVPDHQFAENRTVYFTYSDPSTDRLLFNGAGTAIASARFDQQALELKNVKTLFSMEGKDRSGHHFGSRIVPDGKGRLWFTIGDRGTRERAQDPFDAAGSVLRINTDGSIPADNPFADGKKGLSQIWSIGHRNPQGATLNDVTGELWTLAHGAKGGDEINIPEAGKNYGWPVISYGVHYSGQKIGKGYSAPGYEQPIYYWDPSIAPSGMDFYTGDKVKAWQGNLFVGALKYQTVVRLEVDGNTVVSEERLFEGDYGRIRDVRSFSDGALWFLTDDSDGAVYRITGIEDN